MAGVNDSLSDLTGKCRDFIAGPGAGSLEQIVEYAAEARYPSQIWEIEVPLADGHFTSEMDVAALRDGFHGAHETVFAIADRSSEVEAIGWRASVRCRLREDTSLSVPVEDAEKRPTATRRVYFEGVGIVDATIRHFEEMTAGQTVQGPAIIESSFTTVVIEPGGVAERRATGGLMVTPAQAQLASSSPKNEGKETLGGVRLAILNKRFEAISAKMANTLLRSGRSGVLNSARDFS